MSGVAIVIQGADFSAKSIGQVTLVDPGVALDGISINSEETCYHGEQLTVDYNPTDVSESKKGVTWSVVSGNEYGTINNDGILNITDFGTMTVRATSVYDNSITDTATFNVAPYESQIEFFNGNNGVYFDTGIKGSSNIRVEIKCLYRSSYEGKEEFDGMFFGSRVGNLNKELTLNHTYASNFRFGNQPSNWFSNSSDRILIFNSTEAANIMKVYDTSNTLVETLTTTFNTFNNDLNIYLCGLNGNGAPNYSKVPIYYAKIYNGTTLVRDYIPVRVGTKGYMYDRANKVMYEYNGEGTPILGNDVE